MKGTIRQRRPGGKFTAYWWETDPKTGKLKQHSQSGFTGIRAAQGFLNTQLAEVAAGKSHTVDRKITLRQLFEDHWLPVARSGAKRGSSAERRRPTTVSGYETIANAWILPHIGGVALLSLTPKHVDEWLTALQAHGGRGGRPLGARSAQASLRVLKTAIEYAVDQGMVARNAAMKASTPGGRAREMTSWTVEEAREFLELAKADRLRAAWLLCLLRGLRRGEVAGLRWDAVDLEARKVRIVTTRVVVGGTKVIESLPKTAKGYRTIPLDDTLVAALKQHRAKQLEERLAWGEGWTDSGFVFVRENGEPFAPPSISQRFERLCITGGIRRIRLHDLRHTCATLAQASGMPVERLSKMLGHADVKITLSIYTHSTEDDTAESAATFTDSLLGNL
ncbi:MAG TPA: tyrosine-type recombinase/integrase [Acidothermaceae bacterium]